MSQNAAQPEAPAVDESKPVVPADDEITSLRAKAAELETIKAKLDIDKKAARDAVKAAQAEAEKAGEIAKAYESAKARLAELEPLEPLAKRWQEHESAEVSRLDKRAEAMPPAFVDLYKGASDLASKARVLAAFDAMQPAVPAGKVPATPPALGAPASSGVVVDFESALRDPKKWTEAKTQDPKGALAWIQARMSPQRGSSAPTFARPGRA